MHSMISSLVIVASGVAALPAPLNPIFNNEYFAACSFTSYTENDFATWPGPLSDSIPIDGTLLAYRLRFCSDPPKSPASRASISDALTRFSQQFTNIDDANNPVLRSKQYEMPFSEGTSNGNGRTIAITMNPIPTASVNGTRQMTYTFNNTEASLFLLNLAQSMQNGGRVGDLRYSIESTDIPGPAPNGVASGSVFSL